MAQTELDSYLMPETARRRRSPDSLTDSWAQPVTPVVDRAPTFDFGASEPTVTTTQEPWSSTDWLGNLNTSIGNGSMFTDPATVPLQGWIAQRVGQLNQPINDPAQAAFADLVKNLSTTWANPGNAVSVGNGLLPESLDYARKYLADLQTEPFSAGDEAALKAKYFNGISSGRKAATERGLEQAAARGLSASSGPTTDILRNVNQQYDTLGAQAQNNLMMATLAEKIRRAQEAMGVANTMEGWGAQDASQQMQAQEFNAQNRNALQSGLANLVNQWESMNRGARSETNQNQAQIGNLLASLSDLAYNRGVTNPMAVVNNMTPNPSSIANQLQTLYANATNQQQTDNALTQQSMYGLGQLLALLMGNNGGNAGMWYDSNLGPVLTNP